MPDAFSLADGSPSTKRKVDNYGTQVIGLVLTPQQIHDYSPGQRSFVINFINSFNPRNILTLTLNATLTSFQVQFDRLVSGELVLPPLYHPFSVSALPCDNWFVIENTGDEDIKFEVGVELSPGVSEFVKIDILSRFSNSPLVGTVALAPHGTIEVRVCAFARKDSRLPINSPNSTYFTHPNGITFGKLWISTKQVRPTPMLMDDITATISNDNSIIPSQRITSDIPIRGIIVEGPTFTISTTRMTFRSLAESDAEDHDIRMVETGDDTSSGPITANKRKETRKQFYSKRWLKRYPQRHTCDIVNLSNVFPLDFKVKIEGPIELQSGNDILRISPLNPDMTGKVEPDSTLSLTIELTNLKIGGLSEDVKVIIQDLNSLSKQSQTIYVSVMEPEESIMHVRTNGEDLIESEEDDGFFKQSDDEYNGSNSFMTMKNDSLMNQINYGGQQLASPVDETDGNTFNYGSIPGTISSSMDKEPPPPPIISSSSPLGMSGLPPGSLVPRSMMSESTIIPPTRRHAPHLHLKGCKRLGDVKADSPGLYELDLGQQDLGSTNINKKLILENVTFERASYRIKTLSEQDKSWMILSRIEGTLDGQRSGSGSGVSNSGLSPLQKDSHVITITFMTNSRGVYSTYLLIENLDNRTDTKIIRVTIEVVAKQNIRRTPTGSLISGGPSPTTGSSSTSMMTNNTITSNDPMLISNHVFDVYVNGIDSDYTRIEMDKLYYETEYSGRSIVVYNRESVPLEFSLKSNLHHNDPSELIFSLSRTTPKLFKSLTIDPESHVRVYIRFRPSQDDSNLLPINSEEKQQQQQQNNIILSPTLRSQNDTRGIGGMVKTFRESNRPHEKNIEIYINCRLVKDYQKIVPLHAVCRWPQIHVSTLELLFRGKIRQKTPAEVRDQDNDELWYVTLSPPGENVTISNVLEGPLDYEIMNDTLYFKVEEADVSGTEGGGIGRNGLAKVDEGIENSMLSRSASSGSGPTSPVLSSSSPIPGTGVETRRTISGLSSQRIRIVVDLAAVSKNAESLRREKYIQEHMTIYNRRRPSEKYWLILKLSFGNLTSFQSASGSKTAFSHLESAVAKLLRDLSAFPKAFLVPPPNHSSSSSSNDISSLPPPRLSAMSPPISSNILSSSASSSTSSSSSSLPLPIPSSSSAIIPSSIPTTADSLNLSSNDIQKANDLHFRYLYVIDQIIWYGTREQSSENYLQLGQLLFSSIFSYPIFKEMAPAFLKPSYDPNGSMTTMTATTMTTTSTNISSVPSSSINPNLNLISNTVNTSSTSGSGTSGAGSGGTSGNNVIIGGNNIRIWPSHLNRWVRTLNYFMSFFPQRDLILEPLRELLKSLICPIPMGMESMLTNPNSSHSSSNDLLNDSI